MIKLTDYGVILENDGSFERATLEQKVQGTPKTMAHNILKTHNYSGDMENLQLRFDALVSPDNNYVSILQTVRACGIEKFPIPYVLSNCHNTLCAIGGTINEDDHVYGLGNVKKFGGILLPSYSAVLHQYMCEMMAGCGKMILGSDSHTRYGSLGTLGFGEGGGEIAKQLLESTYDIARPSVIAVKLTGTPRQGVGPHDVALTLISATFKNNFNKNKILEFVGDGIQNLSLGYRIGIDVMTTESAALSSIWCTDEKTRDYLKVHGRKSDYKKMVPEPGAYYDGLIEIDLSTVECMIALPFHPSNAMSIKDFKGNMYEVIAQIEEEGQKIKGSKGEMFSLRSKIKDGELYVDQGLVSGCSGGMFENIVAMADILRNQALFGDNPQLGINPASLPIMSDLMKTGIANDLTTVGVTLRPCICGPCFGVTDVPANNQFSIRHTTRNYPNREGSKPGQGQMACVALMDARSIAATISNGGKLTAATELDVEYSNIEYSFNKDIYKNKIFNNYKKGNEKFELIMGPNIADWPEMYPFTKHLLLKVAGAYSGSISTDDLVPSGEATSYRSNPHKISEFTLNNRDKEYVRRAKFIRAVETMRREEGKVEDSQLNVIMLDLCKKYDCKIEDVTLGSVITSEQIGDGSSREQAASNQKVLGGYANLVNEYSTKRYRSNLINWGILPLLSKEKFHLENGDYLFIPDIRDAIMNDRESIEIYVVTQKNKIIPCTIDKLTNDEKQILLDGCLINYYQYGKNA